MRLNLLLGRRPSLLATSNSLGPYLTSPYGKFFTRQVLLTCGPPLSRNLSRRLFLSKLTYMPAFSPLNVPRRGTSELTWTSSDQCAKSLQLWESVSQTTSTPLQSFTLYWLTTLIILCTYLHLPISSRKTLKPDYMMCYLTQEYDHLNAGKAESSKGEKGVAFTASSSSSSNHGQKPK